MDPYTEMALKQSGMSVELFAEDLSSTHLFFIYTYNNNNNKKNKHVILKTACSLYAKFSEVAWDAIN